MISITFFFLATKSANTVLESIIGIPAAGIKPPPPFSLLSAVELIPFSSSLDCVELSKLVLLFLVIDGVESPINSIYTSSFAIAPEFEI